MSTIPEGHRRGRLILAALLITFAGVRLWLWFAPDADFDIGPHNIHHLYTGLILLTLTGLPLMVRQGRSRWLDGCCLGFGAGLALALDEVVYLIMTDGSNAAYWFPESWWGGLLVVGLAATWLLVLLVRRK